jgi:acyl-CoA hydrolase
VVSRGLVRYVVIEHGVTYLHGKTTRERAKALVEIADPKNVRMLREDQVAATAPAAIKLE